MTPIGDPPVARSSSSATEVGRAAGQRAPDRCQQHFPDPPSPLPSSPRSSSHIPSPALPHQSPQLPPRPLPHTPPHISPAPLPHSSPFTSPHPSPYASPHASPHVSPGPPNSLSPQYFFSFLPPLKFFGEILLLFKTLIDSFVTATALIIKWLGKVMIQLANILLSFFPPLWEQSIIQKNELDGGPGDGVSGFFTSSIPLKVHSNTSDFSLQFKQFKKHQQDLLGRHLQLQEEMQKQMTLKRQLHMHLKELYDACEFSFPLADFPCPPSQQDHHKHQYSTAVMRANQNHPNQASPLPTSQVIDGSTQIPNVPRDVHSTTPPLCCRAASLNLPTSPSTSLAASMRANSSRLTPILQVDRAPQSPLSTPISPQCAPCHSLPQYTEGGYQIPMYEAAHDQLPLFNIPMTQSPKFFEQPGPIYTNQYGQYHFTPRYPHQQMYFSSPHDSHREYSPYNHQSRRKRSASIGSTKNDAIMRTLKSYLTDENDDCDDLGDDDDVLSRKLAETIKEELRNTQDLRRRRQTNDEIDQLLSTYQASRRSFQLSKEREAASPSLQAPKSSGRFSDSSSTSSTMRGSLLTFLSPDKILSSNGAADNDEKMAKTSTHEDNQGTSGS